MGPKGQNWGGVIDKKCEIQNILHFFVFFER